ncbi:tRNA uridine 5-carboxymethylaminomethyl modification enzyme GidA [Acetobacter estunensis NRIC 0472]|uniref:tRNA uridine 5-carboxymethylaminomethyl modification enzyme MnmG n=1 Tax=Acetobacter estunensis TaxID=104097 RepID=A0A967EDE8_9PROT|nr:tRNA uridine-5-carboxymethylaminomethyl(34) synthesis enzyme MnmG [Acetobacter estunensis]NHO54216.1 tRNA uridine-5-carboxymethylaminomethyl(34) synthesis enzyme MnmG [Acetobacter estunensis]GBQ24340.1 tRNA uridine 5-carboxymethylaminomethyl modification enzyme GidA [Acetobacter estunensis NRIC 0472]
MKNQFDVIVVGGGHAGCEAAAAAARCGARTVLLTHRMETVGAMSCNPAIGGIGKGHLVREIDALDGLMGRAADAAGIHFKLLNRSKGPAVHGPRAQADRGLYRDAIHTLLHATENLTLLEAAVDDLNLAPDGSVSGVTCEDGRTFTAPSVVIAAGTFLRGVIHFGHDTQPAGRVGDRPANALGRRLEALGLPMGRLKTGTPARLDRASIDWESLAEDAGDAQPEPFSRLTERITNPQISCRITATNERTHDIIRDSLHLSAVYSGAIAGRGPRYCPSIEDKVVRFAERTSHQIFLEPEALPGNPGGDLVYPNGISTSLPPAVQERMIRTMAGLENARIVRPGYAVEYDYIDPRALTHSLELRAIPGLFMAGQINGTTGYEEAGAQGLLAGVNAAHRAAGNTPVTLSRSDAYIGVMIDDLVTQGVSEPYRMFTSRAEYRLTLRADNADLRLTPIGETWGCVDTMRATLFGQTRVAIQSATERAAQETWLPAPLIAAGVSVSPDGRRRSLLDVLATGAKADAIGLLAPWFVALPPRIRLHVETEARYSGYLARQEREIRQLHNESSIIVPEDFDFSRVGGLSAEMRERFERAHPANFAAAQRIPGVTPSALMALLAHLKQQQAA